MLFPLLAELCASYLLYTYPVPREQIPLLWFIVALADVWNLTVVGMYAIDVARGKMPELGPLGMRALKFLPKIFISYLVTSFFLSFGFMPFTKPLPVGMLLVMLVLMSVFFFPVFLWLPAFCIGETMVPENEDDRGPELDLFGEGEPAAVRSFSFFKNKIIFELGLTRSFLLTRQAHSSALQLILLLMLSHLVFPGLFTQFFGDALGFLGKGISLVLLAGAKALVIGVWAATFVLILPPNAKRELGMTDVDDGLFFGVTEKKFLPRLQGRIFPNALLIVFVIATELFLIYPYQLQQAVMPEAVLARVEEASAVGDELRVVVQLSDVEKMFRWDFDADNFTVVFGDQSLPDVLPETGFNDAVAAEPESSLGPLGPEKTGEAKGRIVHPRRVDLFGADHRALRPDNFAPYGEPLTFVLYFSLPETPPKERQFSLYYRNPLGLGRQIYSGEFDFSPLVS